MIPLFFLLLMQHPIDDPFDRLERSIPRTSSIQREADAAALRLALEDDFMQKWNEFGMAWNDLANDLRIHAADPRKFDRCKRLALALFKHPGWLNLKKSKEK